MTWQILQGDCLQVLRTLPANSFHAAVTSPPYFALRDYKTPGQIGLEKSPELFLGKLVEVFREVRRVLRPDGVCWVNMGDTYGSAGGSRPGNDNKGNKGSTERKVRTTVEPGSLLRIPSRLVDNLVADGWYIRASIIWRKPAPMPESVSGWRWQRCRVKVGNKKPSRTEFLAGDGDRSNGYHHHTEPVWTDCPGCKKCLPNAGLVLRKGSWRPTRSHEFIFMLTKSDEYFADGEAVRTKLAEATVSRDKYSRILDDPDEQFAVRHDHETVGNPAGANLRDVWDIGPEPLKLGHYAAFPSELPRLCLKASCSEKGCCPACGSQWARVIEQVDTGKRQKMGDNWDTGPGAHGAFHRNGRESGKTDVPVMAASTIGWRSTCSCPPADPIPPLILDPFAGAGTTILAARRLGLRAVGIELNPSYAEMARKRIVEDNPLFNMGAAI